MSVDTVPSAYPRTVEQLLPDARALAAQLGEIPSRNRLMREFRIGAPKAEEIRDTLAAERLTAVVEQASPVPEFEEPNPWTYAEPVSEPAESEPGWSALTAELRDTLAGPAVTAVPPAGPVTEPVAAPSVTRVPEMPISEPEPAPVGLVGSGWRNRLRSHTGTDTRVREAGSVGTSPTQDRRPVVIWPVWLLMLPAFVAVWAGWVELGKLTGFGVVNLLPGIAPDGGFATINSAITLPVGMEVYAAYALYVWLSRRVPDRARKFAMFSALAALTVGGAGQVAYHLLAAPPSGAPWGVTMAVACLPVAVLGMGAALGHLVREGVDR